MGSASLAAEPPARPGIRPRALRRRRRLAPAGGSRPSRLQPAELAAVGRIGVGRLGRRQAVCASRQPARSVGAARHVRGLRGVSRPATRRPTCQAPGERTATKFINNSMTTLTRPYNKYTCKSHKARYTSLQVHYCSSVPVFLLSQNILLLQASNPRRRPLLWGVELSHKRKQVPPASSSTSESENQKMSYAV